MPRPFSGGDREAAMDTHQLRAGQHTRSRQCLHRIECLTNRPDECHASERKECPGSLCAVCGEEADTPEHVLLRCPCLTGVRLRVLGNINIEPIQLQDDGAVATLARGFWHHLKPLADGRR